MAKNNKPLIILALSGLFIIITATIYLKVSDSSVNIRDKKQSGSVFSDQNTGRVTINFSTCEEGRAGVPFGLGSTSFTFTGLKNGNCGFYMGTEIEDPNWDGTLDTKCSVPQSVGTLEFPVGDMGIQFGGFVEKYCNKTS